LKFYQQLFAVYSVSKCIFLKIKAGSSLLNVMFNSIAVISENVSVSLYEKLQKSIKAGLVNMRGSEIIIAISD